MQPGIPENAATITFSGATELTNEHLDEWAISILADPVKKTPCAVDNFKLENGVIDARVYLKNTYGYSDWKCGQDFYESWERNETFYQSRLEAYKKEIENDMPVYDRFKMAGDILDVGGLTGTVREFLSKDCRYVSIDPFIDAFLKTAKTKIEAYQCLKQRCNFVGAVAEFIPFRAESFDWVHMRSMLDHVQVPDLALREAYRVLKPDGSLLIGLSVEGGKSGRKAPIRLAKDIVKETLGFVGMKKYKDSHTWHPTYVNLLKLITDNGFEVKDTYWQPYWKDQVVYVLASKG
ncbi:class I SAM-dependent methyltransferase [Geomonas propionica]|uniref:Methyltransferase domain-containing protein n=1 Tax=Geomonas propionica TaxID=2798582 RepID=A0ABS0YVG0_9BACT|nr:class I SAM-dependent methyltransferase [Geomonas propionica]MBJ6801946.1 methyltransferase domain-containing protein [Geomonas propionica]